MKRTISYKGYIGSVEIDEEDHGFGGIILNIDKANLIVKLVHVFCISIEIYNSAIRRKNL